MKKALKTSLLTLFALATLTVAGTDGVAQGPAPLGYDGDSDLCNHVCNCEWSGDGGCLPPGEGDECVALWEEGPPPYPSP